MKERVWHRAPSPVVGALLVAWLFGCAGLAEASNGITPLANGPKAAGRGSADIAVARDGTAINTNPAGLVQLPNGTRTDSLLGIFSPQYFYQDANDEETAPHDLSAIPNFALVYGVGRPDLRIRHDDWKGILSQDELGDMKDCFFPPNDYHSRVAFGLGVFVQGGGGNHVSLHTRLYPEDGVTYYTNFSIISLAPAVALQLTEDLSFGLAFNLNYGTMKVNALISQPPSLLQGHVPGLPAFLYGDSYVLIRAGERALGNPNAIDSEISGRAWITDCYAWGWGGKAGLMWKPTDQVTLGATWTPRTYMEDFKGKAKVDYTREIDATPGMSIITRNAVSAILAAPLGLPLNTFVNDPYMAKYEATIKNFQLPEQWGLGVSIQATPQLLLAFDYKYISWERRFRNFTTVLTHGSDPKLNLLIGSDTVTASLPLNWSDSEVFALGMEYRINEEHVVRVGYEHTDNIVPSDTAMPLFPIFNEDHISLGWGYQYDNWEFDVAWEHAFVNSIRTQKSIQSLDLQNSRERLIQDTVWLGAGYKF